MADQINPHTGTRVEKVTGDFAKEMADVADAIVKELRDNPFEEQDVRSWCLEWGLQERHAKRVLELVFKRETRADLTGGTADCYTIHLADTDGEMSEDGEG